MAKVFLDFETRSAQPIRLGTSNYADHESTQVLCLASAVDDEPASLWTPGQPLPPWFDLIKDPETELHAHNARFERLIWARQYRWPQPALRQWHCTAAQAAAAGLPRSLSKAARAAGLHVDKDSDGKALIRKLCVPRKETKSNKAEYNDDAADLTSLYAYCVKDVEVERELHKILPPLPPRERRTYILDQIVNDRGFQVDLALVEKVLRLFDTHEHNLKRRLKKLTGGQVTSGSQVARMITWLEAEGVYVNNLRADTVARLLAGDLEPLAREVLEIRVQLAKASVKKYLAFKGFTSADDRCRGAHLYFGAGTGRWAGQGVQTQNFPRGSLHESLIDEAISAVDLGVNDLEMLFGDVSSTLSSLLRPMIVAKPGHRLIVVDFASIEARALAWMAGQDDLVKQFEQGMDTYKTLASAIYNVPVDEVNKAQRQVGKIARLGLGYQMGWSKFQATAAQYGVVLEDEFCQKVVETYREQSPAIVKWWRDLERGAIGCVQSGQPRKCQGGVSWHRWKKWLMCRLPSGRYIPYYLPTVVNAETQYGQKPQLRYMGVDSVTKQFRVESTYGGKLTENIIQGTCRDLLVDAMVRLEHKGYPVVMHVHDEVVVEVRDDFGSLEEVERLVTATSVWAKGCPIGAEGFVSKRYRK